MSAAERLEASPLFRRREWETQQTQDLARQRAYVYCADPRERQRLVRLAEIEVRREGA